MQEQTRGNPHRMLSRWTRQAGEDEPHPQLRLGRRLGPAIGKVERPDGRQPAPPPAAPLDKLDELGWPEHAETE